VKIAGQQARLEVGEQPAAQGTIDEWSAPATLVRIAGGAVLVSFQFFLREQFRVLRKYRLGQCKSFRGRRRRQQWLPRWLYQQIVKLNVQPEGWSVTTTLWAWLEYGHEGLLSSMVCNSTAFESARR
jgi:hypothetical protein